jgi:uncharacterized protein (TIGR02246 family)
MIRFLIGVTLLFAAGAAGAAELDDVRARVEAVNRDWVAAIQAGDFHRSVESYAADAVFVTRDGKIMVGPAAIEQAAEARGKSARLFDGTLETDDLRAVGGLYYEYGHASLHWQQPDGTIRPTEGRFVTIWRHDPDGQWRVIRNLTL